MIIKMEQQIGNYYIRPSLFNLVELSLLARMYEESCVPRNIKADLDSHSLAQTLLKMKATEGQGILRVVLFDASPVGFYWQYQGQTLASWVSPEHLSHDIKKALEISAC